MGDRLTDHTRISRVSSWPSSLFRISTPRCRPESDARRGSDLNLRAEEETGLLMPELE
jgi:hypothetical protein